MQPKLHLCSCLASANNCSQWVETQASHGLDDVKRPFLYLLIFSFLHLQQFALPCSWVFPLPSGESQSQWGRFARIEIKKIIMFTVHILQVSSALAVHGLITEQRSSATDEQTIRLPGRVTIYFNEYGRNTYLCFVQLNEQLVLCTLYTRTHTSYVHMFKMIITYSYWYLYQGLCISHTRW